MQITLNHQNITCPEGTTLEELLRLHGIKGKHIALALDNRVIKRELWAEIKVQEGDNILVIGAIKGG